MKPSPKLGRAGLLRSGTSFSWRAKRAALRCRTDHGIDTCVDVEMREKLQRKGKQFLSETRRGALRRAFQHIHSAQTPQN